VLIDTLHSEQAGARPKEPGDVTDGRDRTRRGRAARGSVRSVVIKASRSPVGRSLLSVGGDPKSLVGLVNSFLVQLAMLSKSSHPLRSFAFGLADFANWVTDIGVG
jgi:hypothetical protein